MMIKMKFRRETGKAILALDATELHNYLREIGVPEEDGKFLNGPGGNNVDVDVYSLRITPSLLLKTGPQEVDLTRCFGRPLTLSELTTLADTASDTVRNVIDHYRPIEISVVIAGKKVA